MKKLILLTALFSASVFADYANSPLYPVTYTSYQGNFVLSKNGVAEATTYKTEKEAQMYAIMLSQQCSCDVLLTPPTTIAKTIWKKNPTYSSSAAKSSAPSSAAKSSSSAPVSSSVKSSSTSSAAASSVAASVGSDGLITPIAITGSSTDIQKASLAIDKSSTTRWESKWLTDPTSLTLDYGSSKKIVKLGIDWEDSNAKTYTVLGSDDLSTWATLTSVTNGAFGARTDSLELNATNRYIKLNFTSRPSSNSWGYSIYEIKSYTVVVGDGVSQDVSVQFTAPNSRVDGKALPDSEIIGYDFRKVDAKGNIDSVIIPHSTTSPINFKTKFVVASTDTFQIATIATGNDGKNLYSNYVNVN